MSLMNVSFAFWGVHRDGRGDQILFPHLTAQIGCRPQQNADSQTDDAQNHNQNNPLSDRKEYVADSNSAQMIVRSKAQVLSP